MSTVEILVKVVDESTADLEKIEKGYKDLEKTVKDFDNTLGSTERASSEMTKGMIEAGKASKGFSTDIIGAEEEVTKLWEAEQRAAKEGITLAEAMDTSGEAAKKAAEDIKAMEAAQKESDKQVKKASKGFGGMVKGLLGVATAYAVGRKAMDFAKDSLAAADAAGELPPVFDESTKASERLKLAAGKQLGNALEGTVTVMTRVKNSTAENLELTNRIVEAEREGILTTKEANILRAEQNLGMRSHVNVLGELTEKENEYTKALENQAIIESRGRGGPRGQLSAEVLRRRRISGRGEATGGEAGRGLEARAGFGGEIGGMLDALSLAEQGQVGLQDKAAALVEEYKKGTKELGIWAPTLQRTEQELAKIAVAQAQMALESGRFGDEWAVAAVLAEELKIPIEEALDLLRGVNREADKIDGRLLKMGIRVDLFGSGAGFVIAGGLGGGAGVTQGTGSKVFEARAAGGPVVSGRTYMVGENGPEPFTPNTSGNITSNDAMGGSSAAVEAGLANLSKEFKNGLLDLGQTIVAAVG